MDNKLIVHYQGLPPSVNEYLKPSVVMKDDKPLVHMYETAKAKQFKKRFRAYLKNEVKRQGWDIEQTSEGHWYLDCVFYMPRTNADSDNRYKVLLDSFTGIATLDDKNVLARTQMVMYDAKNPRFSVILRRTGYRGIFRSEQDYKSFFDKNCSDCKRNVEKCTIRRKALEGRVTEDIATESGTKYCINKKSKG